MNQWNPRIAVAALAMLLAGTPALAQQATETAPAATAATDAVFPDALATPAAPTAEAVAPETAPAEIGGPQLTSETTLYSGATPRSRQLGTLPKGSHIKIESGLDNSYGRWLLVRAGGQRGWISTDARKD